MKTPDQTDPWEEEFRKRFEHFEAEPPADALARILKQANAPEPPLTGRVWWRYGAMALIAFLLMIAGYVVVDNQPDNVVLSSRSGDARDAEKQITAVEQQATVRTDQPEQTDIQTEHRLSPSAHGSVPSYEADESKPLLNAENKADIDELTTSVSRTPTAATRVTLHESSALRSGKLFRNKLAGGTNRQVVGNDLSFAKPLQGINNQKYTATAISANVVENIPVSGASGHTSPVEPTWYNPALAVAMLSGKGISVTKHQTQLPDIQAEESTEPAQSKPRQRPVWFVSLMPLYTFRQISPNTADDVYVRQIKTDNGLSGDRVGWRMQAGGEWRLTKWASLRLGVNYGQFRQTVQYSVGAAKPDSIVPDLIDDQTLQLTPVIRDEFKTQTTNWQYAGISADVVWRLGAGKHWTYYATTGASVGGYIGPIRRFSGFYQGAFGIERPVADKLWLRVEPTIQYGWNAVSDHKSLFLIRPYMYGLTVGLRY